MKTEITVITDNIAGESLAGEWGLCLLIGFNGRRILVDAGASDLFLKNMKSLGERVEDVDCAVLSHAPQKLTLTAHRHSGLLIGESRGT